MRSAGAPPRRPQTNLRGWPRVGPCPARVSPALLVLTQPCLCQPSLLAAAQRSQPSPRPLSWNAPTPAGRRAPSWALVPVVAEGAIDAADNTLGTGATQRAALDGGERVLHHRSEMIRKHSWTWRAREKALASADLSRARRRPRDLQRETKSRARRHLKKTSLLLFGIPPLAHGVGDKGPVLGAVASAPHFSEPVSQRPCCPWRWPGAPAPVCARAFAAQVEGRRTCAGYRVYETPHKVLQPLLLRWTCGESVGWRRLWVQGQAPQPLL